MGQLVLVDYLTCSWADGLYLPLERKSRAAFSGGPATSMRGPSLGGRAPAALRASGVSK